MTRACSTATCQRGPRPGYAICDDCIDRLFRPAPRPAVRPDSTASLGAGVRGDGSGRPTWAPHAPVPPRLAGRGALSPQGITAGTLPPPA